MQMKHEKLDIKSRHIWQKSHLMDEQVRPTTQNENNNQQRKKKKLKTYINFSFCFITGYFLLQFLMSRLLLYSLCVQKMLESLLILLVCILSQHTAARGTAWTFPNLSRACILLSFLLLHQMKAANLPGSINKGSL